MSVLGKTLGGHAASAVHLTHCMGYGNLSLESGHKKEEKKAV